MTLDDRLHALNHWLDDSTAGSTPDTNDLDRRHRRQRIRQTSAFAAVIAVLAIGTLTLTTLRTSDSSQLAAGSTSDDASTSTEGSEGADAAGLAAYVLTDSPDWLLTAPQQAEDGIGEAFVGEEFAQVYVRFDTEQGLFSNHEGNIDGTIRVAVGNYDDTLRDLFTGAATEVTIADRQFEIVETDQQGFRQTALVPIDLSERTYLVTARGVDVETLIAMASIIDPTAPIPRIGPAPDDFTVIYAGVPEFAALTAGASVTYQRPNDGGSLTITTFTGVAISCLAHSWAYDNTEIAPIGGDAGVIAQISGDPGQTGAYRALWNRDHDTLIHVVADGIDRDELIRLADQLQLDTTPTGTASSSLELVL